MQRGHNAFTWKPAWSSFAPRGGHCSHIRSFVISRRILALALREPAVAAGPASRNPRYSRSDFGKVQDIIQPVVPGNGTDHSDLDRLPRALEFLCFRIGQEEYAVDIQKVQELRGYDVVTRIANMPASVMGVVNLRGVIVPIVDMRIRFGLDAPCYDATTVVIVLNVGQRVVGMVVDSVSDVITLAADQVKPRPRIGAPIDTEYILGLGLLDERMLILLDIDRLMASADMQSVALAD